MVWQNWVTTFLNFLPRLLSGIMIFIAAIVGSGYLGKWVKNLFGRKISNEELLHLIFLVTRWSVVIIGTVLALDQVNFDVTGFIAGLGVAGFTIGFALQDIAKNFISGLMLLYRQPFQLGDTVTISSFTGTVKEINVRDTVIETLDGELVIIPNRDVLENPIVNITHTTMRRRTISLGLGYGEDADRAMQLFLDAISAVPGVESEPVPTIRAESLGDSALMLSLQFWVNQQEQNILLVQSDVLKTIKQVSDEHQIDLPYPTQSILLRQAPE